MSDTKRSYVVFEFSSATSDLTLSRHIDSWEDAVRDCFELVNKRISDVNRYLPGRDILMFKYNDILEYLEDGRNICFGNDVYGVIDVTEDVEYMDYVVAIDTNGNKQIDAKPFRKPFNGINEFKDFMDRFCAISGMEYKYMASDEFNYLDISDFSSNIVLVTIKIAKRHGNGEYIK